MQLILIQMRKINENTKKGEPEDLSGAYVTATAVTTRTATTHEDLGKNAKTQQLEEKTVATRTTHNLNRQEQRVVTQEVKTTATVTSGEQVLIFVLRFFFFSFYRTFCLWHLAFANFGFSKNEGNNTNHLESNGSSRRLPSQN